jgi:hypothetical protein
MRKREPIVWNVLVVTLVGMPMAALAQADDSSAAYRYDVRIQGKEEGPYNIKASVKPNTKNVPTQSKKKGGGASPDDKPSPSTDAVIGLLQSVDIITDGPERRRRELKRQAEEEKRQFQNMMSLFRDYTSRNMQQGATQQSATSTSADESHHKPGGGEDHHHDFPTDGSPNSQQITGQAINTFFDGLPPQIADSLDGGSGINLSGNDPYADYAAAMQKGDFNAMRQLANSQTINDFNQRIAMLGLAGAAALGNIGKSAKSPSADTFPARDTLRKVADDLHFAGQGLDPTKPQEAKLKAICEDISRIWKNVSQQK